MNIRTNNKNKIILLIIRNGEGWHYLVTKTLSALLRVITLKYDDNFCCLNYLDSFRTKNKLELHKKACKI